MSELRAISRDHPPRWTPLIAVAPGVLLLWLTVGRTPGMIWDSVEYCAAATAFASRGTLATPLATSFDGQFDRAGHVIASHPFVLWPPGYPLVVGTIARLTPLGVKSAAVLVGLISLTVILFSLMSIMTRAADRTTALAASALFGVLPVTQANFRMAVSEPVFLACCALMLLALTRFLDDPRQSLRWSWLAAIAIGTAINVRFTGVLLVVVHAICAVWWLSQHRHTVAQRLTALLSVVAGAAIGSLFLLYRLQTLGCALCESRPPSTLAFTTNLRAMLVAMAQSLPAVYEALNGPIDTMLSLTFLAALFAFRRARPESKVRGAAAIVTLIFAGVYAVGLLVLRTVVEFDNLDTRLVAPAALPLAALVLGVAFRHIEPKARIQVAGVAVLFFAVIGLATSWTRPWRGLTDPSLRDTAFVRYAADHFERRPDVAVFSDDASLLAAQLGFDRSLYWMPAHGVPSLRPGERGVVILRRSAARDRHEEAAALDAVAQRISDTGDVVVWELK